MLNRRTTRRRLLAGIPLVFALVLLAALPLMSACGSSSGPGATPLPVIDLAVGSRHDQQVHVWLDALNNNGLGSPPAVALDLTQYRSTGERVRYVRVYGEQLFVISTERDQYGGAVLIYNDFRNIVGNPPPDVVLDSASDVRHPNYMAIHDGDLYVSSRWNSSIKIFRDVTTLSSGDAADVSITNGIRYPNCVAVTDHALYVVNPGYTGESAQGFDNVLVFNNPKLLASGASADVTLGEPPLMAVPNATLLGSQFAGTKHCFVQNNVLYVTCVDRGESHGNGVWGFSPADGLTDYQAPDFVTGGPVFDNYPMCVRETGGRLWVGTQDYTTGLMGFGFPVQTGALPEIELMEELYYDSAPTIPWTPEQGRFTFVPGHVEEFDTIGNIMIGVSRYNDAVFGYYDASSVQTNQAPDFLLWWPGLDEPITLDAVAR